MAPGPNMLQKPNQVQQGSTHGEISLYEEGDVSIYRNTHFWTQHCDFKHPGPIL